MISFIRVNKDMKAVLSAGRLEIRIFKETIVTPKPMIEIDSMPIIWYFFAEWSRLKKDALLI